MIPQISPRELAQWRDDGARDPPIVLDVREPWEAGICRIAASELVPLAALPAACDRLPRERDIVVVCHHGVRSLHAGLWLRSQGFARVHNLRGGIAAWASDVEPAMPRY